MEYRIEKGWRIFSLILAIIFIAAGLFLLSKPFFDPWGPAHRFFIFFGAFLLVIGGFMYANVSKTRVIADAGTITVERALSSRSLSLAQTAGYRKGYKGVINIIPKEAGGKILQLPPNLERMNELLAWLNAHLKDLDILEYKAKETDILNNEQFGETKTARKRNLRRARAVSLIGGAVSVITSAWAWFYPVPYEPLMFLLLLLPLAAIFFAIRFKGLLRFGSGKASPYPSIIVFVLAPVLGVLMRVLSDYRLYSYHAIVTICIAGALLLALAWFVLCSEAIARESNKIFTAGMAVIIAGFYVFGLVVFTNCFYDKSPAKEFWVTVKSKHINSGKSKSYYLQLDPWGDFSGAESESVSKTMYYDVKVGQQVHIYLRDGKWHIPWYHVTE